MEHSVALTFEDGVTRFITTRPNETVADASYRVGINIPLDCRDGACGTCKCRVESGEFDPGSYIEDALTDEEAAQGHALACQMKPKSDLVLSIAATSNICKTAVARHAAALSEVRALSPTAISFSLRMENAVAFLPGQYVNIDVPGADQRRSYSFSSAPGAPEASFLVRNIPGGAMSTFLTERAAVGTPITFTGPVGTFYLRALRRPILMLAGGTGLAPFLSMLDHLVTAGTPYPIHMVYGVTSDPDLVEVDRLEALAARLPGFTFESCVADEGSAYPLRGYVTRHIAPEHVNGGDVDVYLCGPPAMVEAVRAHFAAQGITPASFHYEKFAPSGLVLEAA